MPENFRRAPATFAEIAERALAYSKANKRDSEHDEQRMPKLVEQFGDRQAEDVTPGEIQDGWTLGLNGRSLPVIPIWP